MAWGIRNLRGLPLRSNRLPLLKERMQVRRLVERLDRLPQDLIHLSRLGVLAFLL
jgi:hypothetical protein